MEKINFYAKKCQALEIFYGWVDQGSEYEIAIEQSLYYNSRLPEIDKIILVITIATRYARCGKAVPKLFVATLQAVIPQAKQLNLEEYGCTSDEIKIFKEDLQDAVALLNSAN